MNPVKEDRLCLVRPAPAQATDSVATPLSGGELRLVRPPGLSRKSTGESYDN